jgi:hypothetical protein
MQNNSLKPDKPLFTLGENRALALSAIEGQILDAEQQRRFASWKLAGLSPAQMRIEIRKCYSSEFVGE